MQKTTECSKRASPENHIISYLKQKFITQFVNNYDKLNLIFD